MSEFNTTLDRAKSRQKRFYIISGISVMTVLLLVAALFVVSRGTRVEIMPEEAKGDAEINVTDGVGFCIGNTVYSLMGTVKITASAPGFKVASGIIDPAYLGKVFPLELFELPGSLVIQIMGSDDNLSKTVWRINGRKVSLSARLDLELKSGSYTVAIDNPYFQLKEVVVGVKRNEQTHVQVKLIPVEGMLHISSKPAGAAIFVDNKEVGLTPLQYGRNGGRYSLRIAAENHIDTVEQLEVTRDEVKVSRNYHLKRKKAKVTLNLMPKDGTLLVNGIKVAEPLFLDVAVKYHLTYLKTGYYPGTQTVLLAADEEKEVSFQLKAEMGKVEIASSPSAMIWIGTKSYGLSPVSITIPAVAHEITFTKQGYRSVSRVVKPKGDAVQKVSVTLFTEYQARLREAPREFTNRDGIKLKLFVIQDSFTTGAARSEKGQRANEFQRKIRLTKPFYAGLFEITNEQFAKFDPRKATDPANTPVISVGWQEAAAYCNWLSIKENLGPFYRTANNEVTGFDMHADGYRLLSEGEWEWLARKSGKTERTIFTWGNEMIIPPRVANLADETARGQVRFYVPGYNDGHAGVAPVGSLNREPSGLYDMAGNVSEWVHDVYSIVPPAVNTVVSNPLGQQRGHARVVKGANFRSGTITTLRPAFREGLTEGRDDVGFRIGRYLYGGENE